MRRRHRHFGMTLVEVLVVIGILALLVAAALPVGNLARRAAKRARMAGDLNSISIALEAYHSDFGDYPRADEHDYSSNRGATVLCRAMFGPGSQAEDGADGFGFRALRLAGVATGRVFGPYLKPESFHLDLRNAATPVILDLYGNTILYYAARAGHVNIHVPGGFVAPKIGYPDPAKPSYSPMYNFYDNATAYPDSSRMRIMLGDINMNGAIDAHEQPATTGPYLLWSAGEDGIYGLVDDPTSMTPEQRKAARRKVDDVTNFDFR